jgi:hypothetical protein
MTEMGYDYADVKDFIEEKGLPEMNADFMIEAMANPNYVNPLFKKQEDPDGTINYDYHDPMSKPPVSFAVPSKPGMNLLDHTNTSMINPSEFDDKNICKVCLNSTIDTVCIPCGHRIMCNDCGQGLKT